MVFDFKIDFKNDEEKNKCMYVQACRFYFKIKPKQNKKTKYIFKVWMSIRLCCITLLVN